MIVEVMLKLEIHDPQGQAIANACQRAATRNATTTITMGEITTYQAGSRRSFFH